MRGRFAGLILPALLAGLFVATPAQAHRLEAEARAKIVRKIQVESWFETGETPRNAKVEVFAADNQLLTEGHLSEEGTFAFFADGGPLRVVVSAGDGHVKTLQIPAANLEAGAAGTDTTGPLPSADRTPQPWLKEAVAGVALLLAAAAFILSLRNAQQLRELKQKSGPAGGA
jgi:hypothetical protein